MSVPSPRASPAHRIAENPGILGFHRPSSVIFLLLKQGDTNTYSLGPVLRMDVGDSDLLPDITGCINSFNPEVVGSNPAPATKLKPSVRESEPRASCVWCSCSNLAVPRAERTALIDAIDGLHDVEAHY